MAYSPPEIRVFLGMTGIVASAAMRQVLATIEKVAQTSASVLIQGESGSGKELIARAVHHYSLRCSKPWVDVSCAALPENLVESELFGFERGAFSGADCAKAGLFELAHKGTLFLDEVGELEPRRQVKLLRVLDGVPYSAWAACAKSPWTCGSSPLLIRTWRRCWGPAGSAAIYITALDRSMYAYRPCGSEPETFFH